MTKYKSPLIWLAVIILLIVGAYFLVSMDDEPGPLDQFAVCLEEKEAVFYGAFWCSHCQNQKELFGQSAKKLPYVECSTPDGNSQKLICDEKNITGYPTWVFADDSRLSGEQSLQTLASKTNCELPQL